MATIQDYLDQIASAVYGKEVRQSIIDAINLCYADAADGITPTIKAVSTDTGTVIYITVGANVTSFTIENGTASYDDVSAVISELVEEGKLTALTIEDGSLTTEKFADSAVTMDKTNFYVKSSAEIEEDWLEKSYNSSTVPLVAISDLDALFASGYETITIVIKDVESYWHTGLNFSFQSSTSYFHTINVTSSIGATYSTIKVDEVTYGLISFTRTAVMEAYTEQNDEGIYAFNIRAGDVTSRFSDEGIYAVVSGEVSEEDIAAWFTSYTLDSDFQDAVKAAIESEDVNSTETGLGLEGKVFIALGDSYTKGMDSQLSTLAETYGMIFDNRGIVSSSIAGDTSGSRGFQPMWNRANTIVSDYTSDDGYTIDDTAYTADDVALITFMGGANDGFGVSTWIGSGINDIDTNHICGAVNHILNVLQENFPNAKIIVITQPSSYSRTVSDYEDSDDDTAILLGFDSLEQLLSMTDVQFSNYAMAIKEDAVKRVAWAYGCPVIDMFHEFPTIFNPDNRSTYWNSDKLHLTSVGYQLITDALETKINELFA